MSTTVLTDSCREFLLLVDITGIVHFYEEKQTLFRPKAEQ